MQSKFTFGFILLAACVASSLAACIQEVDSNPDSWICEGLTGLTNLVNVPRSAKRITILQSTINLIPGNSFTRFGGTLVYLNITNSQVSEIQSGAFSGLPNLRDLILDHNQIKIIQTNWIKDLTNLVRLRIAFNLITSIEPEVFDNLPDLELLDIAHNKLDHCLSVESLKKLKSLDIIYLTGNPWPARCRPAVIFHFDQHHVQVISRWRDSHIIIEDCIAHEPHAQYNDQVLDECVASAGTVSSLHLPPKIVPQL